MRYLTVRLAGEATTLHPLVPTLTDAEVFRDARMVEWAPSFDPPRATVLLYLEGDLERFRDVLEDTDLVVDYDVTAFDGWGWRGGGRDGGGRSGDGRKGESRTGDGGRRDGRSGNGRGGDGRGYAYVHSEPHPTEWRLFEIATVEGLVPVFPFLYNDDGSITVRLVGPADRLQAAVEATPPGVETAVERVGEYDLGRPPIPPSLPARQREALEVALDAGYYEVPREATRETVADRLGCAPSTASEHLRKAERRVVGAFIGRRG